MAEKFFSLLAAVVVVIVVADSFPLCFFLSLVFTATFANQLQCRHFDDKWNAMEYT